MGHASLNHCYRLVWSDAAQGWVAVAEISKARGKANRAGRALTALVSITLMTAAGAADLPTGGNIVAGSGGIVQSGNTLTVTQNTARMAADWQSFSVAPGSTVTFVQPSASAVALNRVLGPDVSVIQGALVANGQVFLVNPNGVLFTSTAQVNVGGIVASTLNISDTDFLAGRYVFDGASGNAVVNNGSITAASGGAIALIAARITNDGNLTANSGDVLLGAGSKVTLDLNGPVKLQVEQAAIDALIEQGGAIKADGGTVLLTAKAAGALTTTVINHTGVIEAQTLATGEKGQIVLLGDMLNDRTVVSGTLDASAPNGGDGGFIETSGAVVELAPELQITAGAVDGKGGEWLIDPFDYTIDSTAAANISATLNTGTDVTITTSVDNASYGSSGNSANPGDIIVDAAITKNGGGDALLTLNADRNVVVNQAIRSNSGALSLQFNGGSAGGSIVLNHDLITRGGAVTLNSLETQFSGGGYFDTRVGGAPTGGGSIRVTGQAVLSANSVLRSGGGNIVFAGDVDTPNNSFLTLHAGAGDVTLGGAVGQGGALWSLTVNANTIAINGGAVTTAARQIYNGNIMLGQPSTVLTQTNADTDFTLQANRSIVNATGGAAEFTIKTTRDIILATGSSIGSSGGELDTVLWSDSDAANGGFIWMQAAAGVGASISTHGGDITLAGGADVINGYAEGRSTTNANGVTLDSVTLDSDGGNIVIRGRGSATYGGTYASTDLATSTNANGIRLHGSSIIDSGVGTIDLRGVARADSGSSNGIETNFVGYTRILSAATQAEAIRLSGSAAAGASTNGWGTFLWGTNTSGIVIAATGAGGGVSIDGQGRDGIADAGGAHLNPNAFVLAASGPISLTGTRGNTSVYEDVVVNGTVGFASSLPAGFGIASPVTASSSDISIVADSLSANRVFGAATFSGSAVQSSGTLSIAPRTAGRAMAVQTGNPGGTTFWIDPTSMFGNLGLFKTGFGRLVFGSSTTGDITLDDYSFDNDTRLNTSGSVVLGDIQIANHALAVHVTGAGSITDAGTVAVGSLLLNGSSAAAEIDGVNTAIGTLAADVASLSVTNSGALTVGSVGSVGGVHGITATGDIRIATLTGDLTVAQNIATTSVSSDAITLSAGENANAGVAAGGDVVLSGTPVITAGVNGRVMLYTGSVSGSTGLSALIGSGSGNFRYNSDEVSSGFNTSTASPGSSGRYAIYREQPLLTLTADDKAIIYGNALPAWSYTLSGLQNGDTEGQAISAATVGVASTSLSSSGNYTAGEHDITVAGAASDLGYGFSYVDGALTVERAQLVGTITADNKIYDGAIAATTQGSLSGASSGDDVAFSTSGSFVDKDAGAGKTVNVSGALSGADAANYELAANDTAAADIAQRSVMVTADAGIKTAGQSDPALTYVAETQSANRGLVTGETLAGNLSRAPGETAGDHAIEQGTLTSSNNPNYAIQYSGASLTIVAPAPEGPQNSPPPTSLQTAIAIGQGASAAGSLKGSGTTARGLTTGDELTLVEVSGDAQERNGDDDGYLRVFVVDGGIKLPQARLEAGQ